jgi:hypothetical protein
VLASQSCLDGQHYVLADLHAPHHVWLRKGPINRPAACIIPRDEGSAMRHLASWRLDCRLMGASAPRASLLLLPTAFQRRRLSLLLAILDRFDAQEARPSMHELASELVYPRSDLPRGAAWKSSAERRRTRRLVEEAFALRDGGYRSLLRGSAD